MVDLPKYHLSAQQADALLAPIDASLREMEHRVQHYLDRVTLAAPDADALAKAHAILANAAREVNRLLAESRKIARDYTTRCHLGSSQARRRQPSSRRNIMIEI